MVDLALMVGVRIGMMGQVSRTVVLFYPSHRMSVLGPLDEAALLSYCHASLDHPARDKPLSLRKIAKARRDDRNNSPSPPQGRILGGQTPKSTKRASSISILSGLGVRDPERPWSRPLLLIPVQEGRALPLRTVRRDHPSYAISSGNVLQASLLQTT